MLAVYMLNVNVKSILFLVGYIIGNLKKYYLLNQRFSGNVKI